MYPENWKQQTGVPIYETMYHHIPEDKFIRWIGISLS